ncbi:UNVERIFIED_CONTAM: hypothetical protein GTU68_016027 [Idotea baltica]|nr:hypothetical protein [Idotea baltica]
MQTQICNRCSLAMRFLKNNFANILLLDLTLPDQNGFAFMEDLKREDINIPTIFLTGNDSEISKVKGLELGADDYVTKPFSAPELVARIHAVLRRAEVANDFNVTKNSAFTDSPFEFNTARSTPTSLEISFPDGEVAQHRREEMEFFPTHENRRTMHHPPNLIHSVWGSC